MAHLIQPLEGPLLVSEAHGQLANAHSGLVVAARQAASRLASLSKSKWGVAAKRLRVTCNSFNATLLNTEVSQPLSEVINQCATVERLLDAMTWILSIDPSAELVLCHPTTSSRPGKLTDNDLIVAISGELWKFEVSDVVSSSSDGNSKELKELRSLGVIEQSGNQWFVATPRPEGRHFLVTSAEFSKRLLRPTRHLLKTGQLTYTLANTPIETAVIEVHCTAP